MPTTHEVTNQPPPLGEYDLFATDRGLAAGLVREGGGWAEARVRAFGATVGGEPFVWGQQANAYPPVLRTHDRFGHRIDEVEYHPAWHALMRRAIEHELHALPWRAARPGAHVARAALFYLQSQAEAGHGCPISMTYAVLPALRVQPDVAVEWEPRFTSTTYDPRPLPAGQKAGALCGMAMTEKQGGSDVRTNTTRARPVAAGRAPNTSSPATSGSALPRCATRSSCSPRPSAGSAVSSCRAGGPTARATRSTSSGSRTSSATARTPRPRSSSTARGGGWSARKVAAWRPSSRW